MAATNAKTSGRSGRNIAGELAYLTRALKAPSLASAVERLAKQARAGPRPARHRQNPLGRIPLLIIDEPTPSRHQAEDDPQVLISSPLTIRAQRRGRQSGQLRVVTTGRWGVRWSARWSRRPATVVASRGASSPTAPGVRTR